MEHQLIKRKYQVEFNDKLKYAIKNTSPCWIINIIYDLLMNHDEDLIFFKLDPASKSYQKAREDYTKTFKSLLRKTKTRLYKEKNTTYKECMEKIRNLQKECKYQKKRVNNAISKDDAKRISERKGGLLDCQEELHKLKEYLNLVDELSYKIVYTEIGDGPDFEHYMKPILDRGCWQFEFVSSTIPSWIQERTYQVLSEENVDIEEKIIQLKRAEPRGSGVNWKSRNRSGGVRHKNFEKSATKIYPKHINNRV